MEVVLLWLDDLDDLVFVLVSLWARLRRFCLQVGLSAAFLLAASELSVTADVWSPALAGVAGSSVAVWAAGALLFLVARRLDLKPALARA
jgi:hypothetical protein